MALERRRPLPAGRYWIDVLASDLELWTVWSSVMMKLDHLKVITTESYDAVGGAEARDFIIFETSAETIGWPEKLGSPTIAAKNVTSSADVTNKPDAPLDVTDQVAASLDSMKTGAKAAIGVGVAIGVVVLGVALFRR